MRIHGETHCRPVDLFAHERPYLRPLNPMPCDVARISTVRATRHRTCSTSNSPNRICPSTESATLTTQQPPESHDLFRLRFIEDKANVVFIGGDGLGKSHLCVARGRTACEHGHSVLFATAIDIMDTLSAARAAGRLKPALAPYLKPALLLIDELGDLPIDKFGANLLFQIISQRYEHGALVITSDRAYKQWSVTA